MLIQTPEEKHLHPAALLSEYCKTMDALVPKERLDLLSQMEKITCPECGNTHFYIDKEEGEIVCTECGLVEQKHAISFVVDFDQSNSCSPEADMSLGKSHGNGGKMTMSNKELFSVIATHTKDAFSDPDIGLRARFMRIYTNTVEHPTVKALLVLGSKRVREPRWQIDNKPKKRICFAQDYAKKLRHIGSYIAFSNLHPKLHTIVDATFALCLKEYGEIGIMNDAFDTLKIDPIVFEGVNLFFTLPRCFA